MAKRSSNPTLNSAARGLGRTLGKIANRIDKVKTAGKKLKAAAAAAKTKGNRPAPPPAKVGAKLRVKVVAPKGAKPIAPRTVAAKPVARKPAAKRPAAKPAPKALTPTITMTPPEHPVAPGQEHLRDSWKEQEREANDAAKAQHGTIVDQRAIARASSGQHWASRKTR